MKLSQQQIQQFDELGYLHIKNPLDGRLLQQLQADADRLQQWGNEALKRNEVPKDFAYTNHFFLAYLNRITQYHLHAGQASLALLGAEQILSIAESLCGPEFINTVDMLILKNQHDDLDLPWHQDLIFDHSKYRVIALGIYLDDAVAGDGALKLIKGSQHQRHDIDAMSKAEDLEIVEVSANAGDIVIHNPMLIHWSDSLKNQPRRRTLYYEFRPLGHLMDEVKWPDKIIAQRVQLMALALTEFKRQHSEKPQFSLKPSVHFRCEKQDLELADCYLERIPVDMANFAKSISDQLVKKC